MKEGGGKETEASGAAERRRARRRHKQAHKTEQPQFNTGWLRVGGGALALAMLGATLAKEDTEGDPLNPLRTAVKGSGAYQWAMKQVEVVASPFADPVRDKLLPDWPMPGVPPDIPQPLVLVLDFEETLVNCSWDRKHGWRYVKRPGLDKFIFELSRYYEIVLFSPSLAGIVDPAVNALDKDGYIMHRLYRDATKFKGGIHKKDLSAFNRPLHKIVVLDNNPEGLVQTANLIRIAPYTDPLDKSDEDRLERLIPFLTALVVEGVKDIPATLRTYKKRDVDAILEEYQQRLHQARVKQAEQQQRGLGGLIRGKKAAEIAPARSPPSSSILSSKDIVSKGNAAEAGKAESLPAAPERKKGGFWQRWSKDPKEAEEEQQRKMEAWQKVMEKKELEKQRRQAG